MGSGGEPKRRKGRPRLDEGDTSVNINVQVPSRVYDRLYARAQRERTNLPEAVRRAIRESEQRSRTDKPE